MSLVICEKTIVNKKAIVDVVCNVCKKSCKSNASENEVIDLNLSLLEQFSYGTFDYSGGFFSNNDLVNIEWHFCEDCMLKLGKWIKNQGGDFNSTHNENEWNKKINDTNDYR